MGCVLLGLLISTGCRGCHRFLGGGAYVVAAWVCRVYEVLSVSLGLVLIPCVNALTPNCTYTAIDYASGKPSDFK